MRISKLNLVRKLFVFATVYSFLLGSLPRVAWAYLPPLSNAQLYTLAARGNVRALKAAVQRGLNIDSLDRYGNTALCHAISQRNYIAYNTLRAAGANPNHPCTQNLAAYNRDSFLASRRVVPSSANSRQAYSYVGDEEFVFSDSALLLGGLVLAGAALAVAFSSGGGGSDGDSSSSYKITENSLAGIVGTQRPDYPSNFQYSPVILLSQSGSSITNGKYPDYDLGTSYNEGWIISNDADINIGSGNDNGTSGGASTPLIDLIDFNTSAIEYGEYIQVAMKAVNEGSTVNNGYASTSSKYDPSASYIITLKNNTTALAAYKNAFANNYSIINIDAQNGTIGMIAGVNSVATNQYGAQININFKGDANNHGVIGMYADTGANAINNGNIYGRSQSSDSTDGTIIGMRGQLINQDNSHYSQTDVSNNGNITLEVSANNRDMKTSLFGMGSWLEDDFLNGYMYLSRAGFINLLNKGTISLNVSLTGSGAYTGTDENGNSSLLAGTGGIVGMRSDGNSTATNNADILVNISDTGSSSNTVSGSAAGMQSVHGGKIINNDLIQISGGNANYGMLSVRGDGKNAEFDQVTPYLENNGNIIIDGSLSYGMASYNGGNSINSGHILMQEYGVGIMHDTGTIRNSNEINLAEGGIGMYVTQNGEIYNTSSGSVVIDNSTSSTSSQSDQEDTGDTPGVSSDSDNSSQEDILSTGETVAILSNNGNVYNDGTILITNNSNAENTVSTAILASNGNVYNTNSISITDSNDSTGIEVGTGVIENSGTIDLGNSTGVTNNSAYALKIGSGTINSNGDISILQKENAYGILATSASITNTADIDIQDANNSYGISSSSGTIINSGAINLANSTGAVDTIAYGLQLNSGNLTNSGVITINNKETSYGIQSGRGNITNTANISILNSTALTNSEAYAIQSTSGLVNNSGALSIENVQTAYGLSSDNGNVINAKSATINIYDSSVMADSIGYGIKTANGSITSNAKININNKNSAYGLVSESGQIDSNAAININGNTGALSNIAYGIMGGTGVVNNNDTITIINANEGYGISSSSGSIVNNALISLSNTQQTQNKTSYGIKSELGSVVNNANITMNVTGDLSSGIDTDSGSYGIWTNQSNIINSANATITFSKRGNGLYSASGYIFNYGEIDMQAGGVGIESASGNITNNGTVIIDDTGVGMKSGLGQAFNQGNIDITGVLSTGMESQFYAENTGNINITGYNSKGMAVTASNAQIINKNAITITTSENGLYNYGMYGADGILSRITNVGSITFTGKGYPATENIGYGIYFANGQALNGGNITINYMYGYGMYFTNSGSLNNAANITLNYGGIGMGGNGVESSGVSQETAAMTNQTSGFITINGDNSYGMQGLGVTTAWNDGSINVNGENSFGIFTTNGSGTNNNTIVMAADSSVGMHSEEADSINKNGATITLNGDNSVGMETVTGGTSSNSLQGAVNQGQIIINGQNSVGMKSLGEGIVSNKNLITVAGSQSSGMQADGSGQVTNNADITVSGDESYGMSAIDGTATNNGSISIESNDSYGMYANGESAVIINGQNGNISLGSGNSKYAMYVEEGSALNQGVLDLDKDSSVAMFVESGSAENQKRIIIQGDNSYAMQATGDGTITNTAGKVGVVTSDDLDTFKPVDGIFVQGSNSVGMNAAGQSTATNEANGVISVQGANSYGMTATGVTIGTETYYGTAVNNGIILVQNQDSEAMYAEGGVITNAQTGVIYTNGLYGMQVHGGTGTNIGLILNSEGGVSTDNPFTAMYADAGTLDNQGRITLDGDNSVGMAVEGTASASNSTSESRIEINGADSIGMLAGSSNSTATNNGIIAVDQASSVAMQAENGGQIVNNGSINSNGMIFMNVINGSAINSGNMQVSTNFDTNTNTAPVGILVQAGSGQNTGTITVTGEQAIAMQAQGGTVTNSANIVVESTQGVGLSALNGGQAINEGTIDVASSDGYAMFADDGGTIENSSNSTILTNGAYAMYAGTGNIINNGNMTFEQDNFHALHLEENGSVSNSGAITLNGESSSAIYSSAELPTVEVTNSGSLELSGSNATAIFVNAGKLTNSSTGKITLTGTENVTAIEGNNLNVSNEAAITVSGQNVSNATGISVTNGNVTNSGAINVSGSNAVAIENTSGDIVNRGTITVGPDQNSGETGDANYAIKTSSGSIQNSAAVTVYGNDSFGFYVGNGGSFTNNGGAISVVGDNAFGAYSEGGTISNTSGSISVNGSDAVGISVSNEGSAINSASVIVTGENGIGISADNASVSNNASGSITVNGTSGIGISVSNGGSASNSASIVVTGENGIGISVDNATATSNNGSIAVSGGNNVGISVTNGGKAINNAVLTVDGGNSIGMSADGNSTITNNNIINISGGNIIAMKATNGSKITHAGSIIWSGSTAGNTGTDNVFSVDSSSSITITGTVVEGSYDSSDGTSSNSRMATRAAPVMMATYSAPMSMSASVNAESVADASDVVEDDDENVNNSTTVASAESSGEVSSENTPSSNQPVRTLLAAPAVSGVNTLLAVDEDDPIDEDSTVSESNAPQTDDSSDNSENSKARILLANGARIISNNVKGHYGVDGSATLEGNKDTYELKNVITSKNADNIKVSGTAWFNDAKLVKSDDDVDLSNLDTIFEEANEQTIKNADENGEEIDSSKLLVNNYDESQLSNYSIILKKGDLTQILANSAQIQDKSLLADLDNAYTDGKQSQLFEPMKMAQTNQELSGAIYDELGLGFFSTFTKQDFDILKSTNRMLNAAIFNDKQTKDVRVISGYDFSYHDRKSSADMDGYEDKLNSIYAMADKKFTDNARVGLGIMLSRFDAEYDNDSNKNNETMVSILAPITYAPNKTTKIVSVPRVGVGFGEYQRMAASGSYEGDTKNLYYGITNEARHEYDFGWIGFEPTLEFNVLGMHQAKIKENSAVEIDSADNFSIEGGVGLYATRLFEFGEQQKLKLRAGGTFYHEFADPYKARQARLKDAEISYLLNKYDLSRNRGVVSVRMDYEYNDALNVYGEFNKFIEEDGGYAINAGMGYKF